MQDDQVSCHMGLASWVLVPEDNAAIQGISSSTPIGKTEVPSASVFAMAKSVATKDTAQVKKGTMQ